MPAPTIEDASWHDGPPGIHLRCELAAACLAHDGGLPQSAHADFIVQSQESLRSVTAIHAIRRDQLVAHGLTGLRGSLQSPERVIEGQVHPDLRRRGIGAYLLSWAHAFGGRAVVRTESLDPSAERLYERHGYRQVFAERVMRRYLSGTSRIPDQPSSIVLRKWSTSTQSAFFSAYSRAFKDRPGFPGWSEAEWVEWISAETGFRPDATFVAFVDGEPVGFIACAGNWIEQVGVIPARRGLGIGETLLRHSMSYLQNRGETECWLNVNLDNPAYQLYRRLGFEVFGTRARYARAEHGDSP